MKLAVILFHRRIHKIYPSRWINDCVSSIRNQTYKTFDVLELNYGNENVFYYKDSIRFREDFPNHVYAMNYLLDKAFKEGNYDAVANVNMDDLYKVDRLQKQVEYIRQGYDVVSAQWNYINENSRLCGGKYFTDADLVKINQENVIGHPVVMYSREFWLNCSRYKDEIPVEDWRLWQREIKEGKKFKIIPEVLMFHRLHRNKVSGRR